MAKNKTTRKNRYRKESFFRRYAAAILQVAIGAAVIVGMSLVFVFAHDWITQCDYFRAEYITVEGTDRLDEKHVRKAANLRQGVNILSVNLTTVRKRLMSEPWISDVHVSRDFPATLAISIREHKPLAVIDLGRLFVINEEGNIFKETTMEEFPGLPIVSGVDYPDWKAEGRSGSKVFDAVIDILRISESRGWMHVNGPIEKISVDREIGLTLKADGPVSEILLGYGDYETKCRQFDKVFEYLSRDDKDLRFEMMDIRNPDRIVARPLDDFGATAEKEV